MAVTRIKVSKEALLGKMRAVKDKQVAAHDRATAKAEEAEAAFAEKLKDEIYSFLALLESDPDKARARCQSAGYRDNRYVELRFPKVKLPEVPSLDTHKLDRLIASLEMSVDDTLSIAADDDYARYL